MAYVFLANGREERVRLTYGELERRSRAVAAELQELGWQGERAVLLFPAGVEYVTAFWGCLLAGVVAVPAYPPRGARSLPRLRAILEDAKPVGVLTTLARRDALHRLLAEIPVAVEAIEDVPAGREEAWRDPGVDGGSVAFLQYTSGSTSAPKGVVLTHRNLLANQEMIRDAFRTTSDSVVVSWLPLYHDMGLIGGMLHPLFLGSHCVLMPPVRFLQAPLRWLQAVSRYRGTVSGAPNFAYDLCARRAMEEEIAELDLSCWRVAFNGAEPVRAGSLERFERAFGRAGFRHRAWFPCYGLAEATLVVSAGKPRDAVAIRDLDAAALAEHRVVAQRQEEKREPARQVSCGTAPRALDLRVVDPATRHPRPAGTVGEIWVAGPGVATGYWNRPEETAETFGARLAGGGGAFLRTGDLGFLADGELYVTGRLKDLVVIRGRNLYPQDLEAAAEASHPALRLGCGAAFGVAGDGAELLVLVHEVDLRRRWDAPEVTAAVRRAVDDVFEVPVEAVVLIRPGTLPKTTSGKVRRRECRRRYLAGELEVVGSWERTVGAGPAAPVAPRTTMEELVRDVWAEVLEVQPSRIGVDHHFFDLGGDSVQAGRLVARLRETSGVELSIEAVFDAPTVARMAAVLDRAGQGDGDGGFGPVDRRRPMPLTAPQRRLWFLDRLEPGNPAYNLAVALDWAGPLRVSALRRALAEVIRRHDALRTVLRVEGDSPAQVVRPRASPRLRTIDLGRLPATSRATASRRLERIEARIPFVLAADLTPRVLLLRLAEARWRVVVSLHHVVSDGWSLGVLVRELLAVYSAGIGGAADLPDLPVQFPEYAAWQRRREERVREVEMAYWRRRLAGPLPVVELPADRPRPGVLGHDGATVERRVPADLAADLGAFARNAGATLFMVLLAGFEVLAYRYTGVSDLVIGTAVANRRRVELERLIGLLVNTLPLRTPCEGDPSFQELLARVRQTTLEALAHRDVLFERLVDELQPDRDPSHRPLVQVMMVLQNVPLELPEPDGVRLAAREVDNGTTRFDLALSWLSEEGTLAGTWRYSRELFDPATVCRMAGHLERLLRDAVARPELPVSGLSLLTDAERQQVVIEWNDTATAFGAPTTLPEHLAAQARRTPDAVALVGEALVLTYQELAKRIACLASRLRTAGVGPEVPVGVLAGRSVELVVALLGVVEAGGAYVPLDPSYPAERLASMAADARLPLVLAGPGLGEFLPPDGARISPLDGPEPAAAAPSVTAGPRPHAGSLAYIIYTSGSTGRPKGVGVSHGAIVNRLLWMQAAYRLGPADAVVHKTPYSFDVSVWEFFWPLMVGARLVVARPGGHRDAAYLADLVARERATTVHFVPSMLQVFAEEPRLGELASLRRVIASGEALPPELAARFLARSGAELHNLYGPTEAAVDVTAWPCRRGEPEATVPIGRPIANLHVHVQDAAGRSVPAGVAGELRIAGAGLGRGYLGRPALTAECFVPDPSVASPGARQYRTGDLVRRRPDGAIEFLGRLDHQVKVRGFRIEPGDIEAALAAHPRVREAVVVARPAAAAGTGSVRLAAYVVPALGAGPDPEELAAHLRERLPAYMVPSAFVVLDALPLAPSGKIDRKALPEPERPEAAATVAAPRTALERRLARTWAEQLGVPQPGLHDDFFGLGGDSVQGALFINRLQQDLGAVVYVMALFENPTVAAFAAYLEESYAGALAAAGWTDAASVPERAVRVGPVAIETMERHLAAEFPPVPPDFVPAPRNRRAVFILSPFRSGSTLLRAMLAGHPALFAPPELELLSFATMGQRRAALTGPRAFAREGLLRAVMELHGCDAVGAEALVARYEGETTQTVYRRLQERIGDGRLLVDKTPRYALDRATLRRAESWFEEPLYVHLVRHPCGTMHSFLESRLDQVYRSTFPPREQAELVWFLAHRNVREHLAEVPEERRLVLRFEDLVGAPRESMEALGTFLGVPFAPTMIEPYGGGRMTDGLVAGGRMMGDPRFHRHRRIDPAVAERWRGKVSPADLGDETARLAEALGYPALGTAARGSLDRPRPVRREGPLPLSAGQRRLWFLHHLGEGGAAYHMPAAVRLRGRLELPVLHRTFAEVVRRHEVLRTTFPADGGRPRAVVHPPAPPVLPVVDLGRLSEPARRAARRRWIEAVARHRFDLARGPLQRLLLVRLGEDDHLLAVTLHHVVADGWSIGLLIRELATLYRAYETGRPSPLLELPLQYTDYAAWEERRLASGDLAAAAAFWRERLAEPRAVLELPTDRPRPAVRSSRGTRLPVRLPPGLMGRVRELARRRAATPFLVLLAAFKALLHRHGGQEDLLVGTPVARRDRAELEGLIGFLVNTLVLRTRVEGGLTFAELLGRVRETYVAASRHEEMPFEQLVEELGVERTLSRPPLVQAMFAFQRVPPRSLDLPGLRAEVLDVDTGNAKLDFLLNLLDTGDDAAQGSMELDTELFDRTTGARLWSRLVLLLEAAVDSPDLVLHELPIWSAPERQQVLREWNDTATTHRAARTLPDRLSVQARRSPEAVAVVADGEALTYRELARRTAGLAARLRAAGVGPEVRVGVLLERSVELVVAVLGVVEAGAAYVPLDPSYPAERLGFMARDARLPLVLAGPELLELVPLEGVRVWTVEAPRGEAPATAAEPIRLPTSLAYVLYTSGSTGRPKGVGVPHEAVANLLDWMQEAFGLGPAEAVVQKAPYSFDVSVWELFWPLTVGARLLVARPGGHRDPAYLAELVARERATTLHFVPAMFQAFAEEPRLGELSSLRRVLVGGEALVPELAERFLARSEAELHHLYGPTEATVDVTAWRCRRGAGDSPMPIGRPIANLRVHLQDPSGRPVPAGAAGELQISGSGVGRGYLGRPSLTAAAFVPDPFVGTPGGRLYRTGDLARRRADGAIEFLGRLDHQVKLRGFRIELGEVEAALARRPGVAAAVAVVREGRSGDRRLVAYAVAAGAELDSEALRQDLAGELPSYMVPATVVALPELPLTATGKVDRQALPSPQWHEGEELVAPRTPAEEVLAAIWAELLGVERVGVKEDFFALGGHSLLATRVVSRVREAFGVELPLRALFEAPTVVHLARRVQVAARADQPPLVPVPRDGELPLSFGQERLWFLDRLAPGGAAYTMPFALRLHGPLDLPALRAALSAVVARHEALRTRFVEGPRGPVQEVDPPRAVPLPVAELSGPGAEAEARRLAREVAGRPFDLAHGPLVRALLVRLGAGDHLLAGAMHHVVSDGWSVGVLVRDLAAFYRREPLPELPVQYPDYAVWQRRWLAGEVLEREVAWWREALAGAPPSLELPTDRPRPPLQSHRGAALSVHVPAPLAGALRAVARERGATLFLVLLAAFQALLARWSGQDELLVGSPVANRTRVETEGLVGFFVNTLALRADLGGAPSFARVLERVKAAGLAAYTHQELPFEKLVEELHVPRDPARPPLVQCLFAFHNAPTAPVELPGLEVSAPDVELGVAKFDLTLTLAEADDAGPLRGELRYCTDLFDATTLRRWLGRLLRLLEAAATEPERPIEELPLLAPAEEHQALIEWNDTAVAYPRERSIVELFDEQVERRPDAVAVCQGHRWWSYRELRQQAGLVAARLAALGTGPEVLVGLAAERSPELVAAMLGILDAGGAYLPLDPSYPARRLVFLLEDAAVPVVVGAAQALARLPAAVTDGAVRRTLPVDEAGSVEAAPPMPTSSRRSGPRSLAYVLYTSGSTGRPKGVAVEHRSVVRLVRGADYASFGPDEVFLQLAPPSFDASTLEIWGPLLNGGRLELIPPEPPDLETLGLAIQRARVTTLWLTAGLFHQMVEDQLDRLAGVHQLLAGGDVLSVAHVARVLAIQGPGPVLVNGYGPTEATTFTCCHRMDGTVDPSPLGLPVPIGRPIASTRAYVLDPAPGAPSAPAAVGVAGELYAGGDGLARGYLARPSLTAAAFVPDRFGGTPGGRLYRTGDLARRRADGAIEFLGRLDHQVKLRGFRIELGEVEAALARRPGVAAAVAVVREGRSGDRRLVAYAVAAGAELDSEALRQDLAGELPSYMVPAAVVALPELPLTANGKVDRQALPSPQWHEGEELVAPRTPAEEVLAAIWAELLGVERVGVKEDFFALGGHSLLATRVVSRVREAFGVELPLRALFEAPTVAELALAVATASRGGAGAPPPLERVARERGLALSYGQERLFFLDRLVPGLTAYHVAGQLAVEGRLRPWALRRALAEVVRRHEVLRTRFVEGESGPEQWIEAADTGRLPWLEVDLGGLGAEAGRAADALARQAVSGALDLGGGRPLRAVLARLGPREYRAVFVLHHIVSDAWSIGVLVRELGALYEAYAAGRGSPLGELPVQYADFAAWQRRHLSGAALAGPLAYWRERLAGSDEVLELPTDRPRPAVQGFSGGWVRWGLPGELVESLEALSRRHDATLFMVLAAGLQLLLQCASGQAAVSLGVPVAGRSRPEVEGLIGFFVNLLVLRTDVAGAGGVAALLARVREAALGALAHQELPFEKLVEELVPRRRLSHPPLFQVAFAFQGALVPRLELPEVRLAPVELERRSAKFDLTLSLERSGEGLSGFWEYDAALFDRTTVERLGGHLETLLAGLAEETRWPVPLLSRAQRQQVGVEWNAPVGGVPERGESVPLEVAAWARRAPEAVSVSQGSVRLSYGELERRVRGWSRRLRRFGVGPEEVVAVCAERSPAMVVALLAVLRAGGAYLPLDPDYPARRLAFMLEDSGARQVLSDGASLGRHPWLAEGGRRPLRLDLADLEEEADVEDAEAGGAEAPALEPASPAYVIYTSGSTGRPKGVVVPHRGLSSLVAWHREAYGIGPGDRATQVAGLSFDASGWEIWPCLAGGAELLLADGHVGLSPEGLRAWLGDERVSLCFLPTPLAERAVSEPWPPGSSLRALLTGGDRLHAVATEGLDFALVNHYGPTESTVVTTRARVEPEAGRVEPPIGRPLPGVWVHVVDGGLREVAPGVSGELAIGGEQLARGYLGRPGRTAAAFVPDPFGGGAGGRLYRSGDRARRTSDGRLEFLGRLDAQVKVRGVRVEPGEVEAALAGCPGVGEAVVVARAGAQGSAVLVGYVVPAAGAAAPEGRELRRRLRETLPEAMVPAAFVVLGELPLSPSGKVDRGALPAPETPEAGATAPRTPTEERIAALWAELLGLESVGVEQSFFELGGHSLLAARVVSRLEAELGVSLPVRTLFEAPTVAELALAVTQSRAAQEDPEEIARWLAEVQEETGS